MTAPASLDRYPSLLRTEAAARAAALTVSDVEVELDLTAPDAQTFTSRTTLRFRSTATETFVDFRGKELTEATLNGRRLDPACWRSGRISLTGLQAQNVLVIAGSMAYSSDGEGLHRHVDPADGATYLYAMSFLDAAPRWFACFDQPDLKARYRITVAAPPEWTVLGNGPSERAAPGRWTLVPPQPLSTYFVTLVAGPYASVTAEHDGIRLGFHARASLRNELEAEAPDMIEVTGQSFDHYHRLFGVRYPFGEYHQAFVPDFNAGAMENPGCVTFRDSYVFRARATHAERAERASVIAHELAHQWFGDLVTLRWWDDLWLNESFAEYLGHRCCTDATRYPVWTEFGIRRKSWGAVADQSPSTHPVAGTEAGDAATALQNFDGISYAKGAAVLRQLVAYLGDDAFLAGLRTYFTRHAFGNAEFAELLACWTEAGAVDLQRWAAAWLQTTGMDLLDVAWDASGASVTVTGPDGGAPPDRTPSPLSASTPPAQSPLWRRWCCRPILRLSPSRGPSRSWSPTAPTPPGPASGSGPRAGPPWRRCCRWSGTSRRSSSCTTPSGTRSGTAPSRPPPRWTWWRTRCTGWSRRCSSPRCSRRPGPSPVPSARSPPGRTG